MEINNDEQLNTPQEEATTVNKEISNSKETIDVIVDRIESLKDGTSKYKIKLPTMLFKHGIELGKYIADNPDINWDKISNAEKLTDQYDVVSKIDGHLDPDDTINTIDRNYVNEVKYKGNTLGLGNVDTDSHGTIKDYKAATVFNDFFSLGINTKITLYHSGFIICFKPPTNAALLDLESRLNKDELHIAKETNNLIYSNFGIVKTGVLIEFMREHILYTTLDIKDDEDVFDYVNPLDTPLIELAVLNSMTSGKIEIEKSCKNTFIAPDAKNNIEPCDFSVSGLINLNELLYVDSNPDVMNKFMLDTLSLFKPSSVSTERALEYQKRVNSLMEPIEVEYEGKQLKINIEMPSMNKYLIDGKRWINKVKTNTIKALGEKAPVYDKEAYANKLLYINLVGMYNTYFKSVEFGSNVIYDTDTIENYIIASLSEDKQLYSTIIKQFRLNIIKAHVAMVASVNFTCPKCKEKQDPEKHKWDKLIPLDVGTLFLEVATLKITNSPTSKDL